MSKLREEDTIELMLQSDATAQVATVTTVADVAGSLDGKYFTFATPRRKFMVWIAVAGEANVMPVVDPYHIAVRVDIAAGATDAAVATAVAAAVDGLARVTGGAATNVVTITNLEGGVGAVDAGDSGFTPATSVAGVDGTKTVVNCKFVTYTSAGEIASVESGAPSRQVYDIQAGDYIVVDDNYIGAPEYVKAV